MCAVFGTYCEHAAASLGNQCKVIAAACVGRLRLQSLLGGDWAMTCALGKEKNAEQHHKTSYMSAIVINSSSPQI